MKICSRSLTSPLSFSVSLSSHWWRPLSSLLIGLLLIILYLGLLNPPTPAHADLADDVIFIGTDTDHTASLAWGDMDGDGDLDLVVGNNSNTFGSLQVYRNEGKGSFTLVWDLLSPSATQVAWGDMDGDGDLDLAVGSVSTPFTQVNQVYRNEGAGNFSLAWESPDTPQTFSVAWGDMDGDGDLDLAFGNLGANQLYRNEDGGNFSLVWESPDAVGTSSVAWGDMDGDGDLDLVFGNGGKPQLYRNNRGHFTLAWESSEPKGVQDVALGDMDGDGDLDLLVGNDEDVNQVYQNDGDGNFSLVWESNDTKDTTSVAWGDMDGDGDLDFAVGNSYQVNQLYRNEGGGNFSLLWESSDTRDTSSVAWGDMDHDGLLDLAVGNSGADGAANQIYRNVGRGGFSLASELSDDTQNSSHLAWGDMDGDGDLDLAVGNWNQVNQVYRNQGGGNLSLLWESVGDVKSTTSIAWGDMDGDGDLDLAVGNYNQVNQIYRHEGGGNFSLVWESSDTRGTNSVAWGDMDGDGDLDLAVGNSHGDFFTGEVNQLYRNENATFTLAWESDEQSKTTSLAWGDMDGDGDLDLAVGNTGPFGGFNEVYRNDNGENLTLAWLATDDFKYTTSIAWGDMDGDGDLDLAFANGSQVSQVYRNDGGGDFTLAWESTGNTKRTTSVAWGDMDGDGDLDLAFGNSDEAANDLYRNEGAGNFSLAWEFSDTKNTVSVAWGDMDQDGDLDLAVGHSGQANQIFENHLWGETNLPNNAPFLAIARQSIAANADFYASDEILTDSTIPVTYILSDPEGDSLARLAVFYSMNGGDNWREAVPTADTQTTNLATSPNGTPHVFIWDTFASGFFGHSDNIVLRFVAYPQAASNASTGTYQYINSTPGPFQHPAPSATTFPFRVRGTQVRVYSDTIATGNELADALVYRLPAGQTIGAEPIVNNANQPFVTAQNGYLQGRGQVGLDDQLIALLPITATEHYTLYHTSAAPTETGLDTYTVTSPGVQELAVSPNNPLMIFDLDVSLEWDARNDSAFLSQLESDLQRTSEILYDLTNGQVALGKIRVYHAKEKWLSSDIVIHASNTLRPSAALGGIVSLPVSERLINNSQVITDAYLPGQVQMSAIWNRFGNPGGGDAVEDWPRTLAHELGHYLLFIPDNYLGLSENGMLIQVDCQGSAMTDAYREDYSEFLTQSDWTNDCLHTLAQHTTGRTDWETITTFYEMLYAFSDNMGPSNLPLNVTQVTFYDPDTPSNTLLDPFFNVTDENGNPLPLSFGQAEAYLFKTQNTPDVTDDYVLSLGSPIDDLLRTRGAEPGDRLCLFDYSHSPRRLGCVEEISQSSQSLPLHEVPGWAPQITVESVTSRTLAITVTQAISPDEQLNVQLLPVGHPTATAVTAPVATMNRVLDTDDTFTQTITLDYPQVNGFVRVWVPQLPLREEMTEFFVSGGWGPGGGHVNTGFVNRRSWNAPVTSSDGEVIIFDLDHIFGGNPAYALQSLSVAPNLPPWLTQIGQAYRFSSAKALTGALNIMFQYMQREVPDGHEDQLGLYYSPDEGQTWQRLDTELDTYRNLASARMPDEGIYTLISTIEMPALTPGWNNFGYPVQEARPVATALASIDGYYTSVSHHDRSQTPSWLLYDDRVANDHPEFSEFVNDLTSLEFGHAYWLYANEEISLYLGVAERSNAMPSSSVQLPPATFYGWINPTASFTPIVGMTVTARIDGVECGQTTIEELDGQLAYKLQVSDPNNCGIDGSNIVFEVGDWVMDHDQQWDNSQAWFHPLTNTVTNTPNQPGNCNGDSTVDAGDISCLVLEIFDGDGTDPLETPNGSHPGTPDSDANKDGTVDAGDLSCVPLIIFNGPGACDSNP